MKSSDYHLNLFHFFLSCIFSCSYELEDLPSFFIILLVEKDDLTYIAYCQQGEVQTFQKTNRNFLLSIGLIKDIIFNVVQIS